MNDTVFEFYEELKENLKAKGVIIIKQENEKNYYGYHFFTALYKETYFYVQFDYLRGNEVTCYKKVGFNEKIQASYSVNFTTFEDLYIHIHEWIKCSNRALKGVSPQEIHWELCTIIEGKTKLHRIRETMGEREVDIFSNIDHIEEVEKDDNYRVLRFVAKDGNYFDFEMNSMRMIG